MSGAIIAAQGRTLSRLRLRPEASCPEIISAALAYMRARNRADQLRALAAMAALKSVYRQGVEDARKGMP